MPDLTFLFGVGIVIVLVGVGLLIMLIKGALDTWKEEQLATRKSLDREPPQSAKEIDKRN